MLSTWNLIQNKKNLCCGANPVQTSIISQSQERFTLTSVLIKNSNNDNRGLYIGLRQLLGKVKQEFNVEEPLRSMRFCQGLNLPQNSCTCLKNYVKFIGSPFHEKYIYLAKIGGNLVFCAAKLNYRSKLKKKSLLMDILMDKKSLLMDLFHFAAQAHHMNTLRPKKLQNLNNKTN